MARLSHLLQRDRLGREITLTLLLKIVAIAAIWYLFFSEPVDDGLSDHAVAGALLGAASTAGAEQTEFHSTIEGETP